MKSYWGVKNISIYRDAEGDIIGLQVQFQWKGKRFYARVPYAEHMTRGEALREAKRLLREASVAVKRPISERRIVPSGVLTGVGRYAKGKRIVWQARIHDAPGHERKTEFRVQANGEDKARALAVRARREWERKFYGVGSAGQAG